MISSNSSHSCSSLITVSAVFLSYFFNTSIASRNASLAFSAISLAAALHLWIAKEGLSRNRSSSPISDALFALNSISLSLASGTVRIARSTSLSPNGNNIKVQQILNALCIRAIPAAVAGWLIKLNVTK